MAHEFDELTLDGHNYSTWALDVKISLVFHGIMAALTRPTERDASFMDTYKYQALYIILNHLYSDLMSEYVMEEEPHSLWVALKGVMNSRRQSCCQRPTMSGLSFIFMTLSLLRTIIMLFTRSAPNYGFVRRNHQWRKRLKRHFKLCSLQIGSYNISIRSRTTNTMLTSFVTYSRLRSMMNLLLRIITKIMLGLLLSLRFITMRRKQVLLRIQIQRRMVGLQSAASIGRRTESSQR
jgi:hypothetical protein